MAAAEGGRIIESGRLPRSSFRVLELDQPCNYRSGSSCIPNGLQHLRWFGALLRALGTQAG